MLRPEGLRTGDLARVDEDGYLYIVGRRAEIIKSGAYRISPTEIEELLLGLDEIAEAAVVGFPDPIWGEAPVAFVVATPGAVPLNADGILEYCRTQLPRHKQLREVRIKKASLPRTVSGKIRRSELRQTALPLC